MTLQECRDQTRVGEGEPGRGLLRPVSEVPAVVTYPAPGQSLHPDGSLLTKVPSLPLPSGLSVHPTGGSLSPTHRGHTHLGQSSQNHHPGACWVKNPGPALPSHEPSFLSCSLRLLMAPTLHLLFRSFQDSRGLFSSSQQHGVRLRAEALGHLSFQGSCQALRGNAEVGLEAELPSKWHQGQVHGRVGAEGRALPSRKITNKPPTLCSFPVWFPSISGVFFFL